MDKVYRNASVVMAGTACLLMVLRPLLVIALREVPVPDRATAWAWAGPLLDLPAPILFGWIGILVRGRYPRPGKWVLAGVLALVPLVYLLWAVLHRQGFCLWGDGRRCLWITSAVLGFLTSAEHLEGKSRRSGILELLLFLGSAACFGVVCHLVDPYGVYDYQMQWSGWMDFFSRAVRAVPLAAVIYFLAGFSFSRAGQSFGGRRAVGRTFMVLSVLSFITVLAWSIRWHMTGASLMKAYRIAAHPVTVYLLVVLRRAVRILAGQGTRPWSDIFPPQ